MMKMTEVEQPGLDRLPQKQIGQDIQRPDLNRILKIRAQIEENLTNRKLNDTEKLDMLDRAHEKYGNALCPCAPRR